MKSKSKIKKKNLRSTPAGRNLLKKFAIYANVSDPDQTVQSFCNGDRSPGTRLEEGGSLTQAATSPLPGGEGVPQGGTGEGVTNVIPEPAASGLGGQPTTTMPPALPAQPSGGASTGSVTDTVIINEMSQHPNSEIPVSKLVEIIGRMPNYNEQIGSILLEKVPFAQRYRIKK